MSRPVTLLLCIILSLQTLQSQTTDLAIGQWKQHLPFNAGIYVAQSDDQIFYATEYALLIIDKADRALERVTKVEGLSRVGVSLVKYNKGSDILMIVYDDGVIDLIGASGNLTLLNVPESDIIIGEKKIYDVYMANDSIAYLAGNFGVTTLNLRSGLFPNTIKMPVEARSVVVYEGDIYVGTPEGIYFIDPASGLNIDDFSAWSWLGDNPVGLPPDYSTHALAVYNGNLYMDVNDSLFTYDGSAASFIFHKEDKIIQYLSAEGAHLIGGFACMGNCDGDAFIFDENNNVQAAGSGCTDRPTYAVEDEQGTIWYADRFNGFRVETPGSGVCERLTVNGPRSIDIYDIDVADGQLWIASGGLDVTFSAQFNSDGLFSLIDGQWRAYNQWNIPELAGVTDFLDVEIHPENGKIYAGAFLDALVEYDPATDEFKIFNETNSSLDTAIGDPTRSRVAGLAFDGDLNLWIANHSAPRPLSVMKADGSFQSFSLSGCTGERGVLEIAIDDFGYKWMMTNNTSLGLIVFDEGDLEDPSDDRCRIINSSNSNLPTNEINVIQVDRDGAVWVGTKLGAIVYQCDPFNGECIGTRPFVEVDGFGANLLEDQDVRAIGIDGADRKWFGTASGVFLMSPEGNEQIAHFTTQNSPLFDNNITDIAFDGETGEIYIGTLKGLVSYRSESTSGGRLHNSKVLVFPNPVRPEYSGPIAIKGLAEDATVKITDVTGQLVFETEALGGQAIWNGLDYNDRKVNTGVYLVFATSRNSTNPDVAVAKILIVN